MSTSLRGLQQAIGPFDAPQQSGGFDPSTDPLGLDLQQRARANRFQYALQNPMAASAGPLPDPHWDAFFQAVNEAGGGRPVDYAGSAGGQLGYDTNNGTMGAGTELYGPKGLKYRGT